MAPIRIRPKEAPPSPRTAFMAALPIAGLLAAGLATTLWLENGRTSAAEAVEAAMPAVDAAWTWAQGQWLAVEGSRGRLEVAGRAWVPADHAPVSWFAPEEMVPSGEAAGWALYANRVRGLPALSSKPRPYDRLYLRTADGVYTPLRWRDVPRP